MSAKEVRKAARTLRDESDDDAVSTEDWALSLLVLDILFESADHFESLPHPLAARLLSLARLVNGGTS